MTNILDSNAIRGRTRMPGIIEPKIPLPKWWLTGGIPISNCLAAWQPMGADDLADSYINLVNPGTYDAAPGTAPTWDEVNGWKFSAGSSQYLDSGIVPANNYTYIGRYSNMSTSSSEYPLIGHYLSSTVRVEIGQNQTKKELYSNPGSFVSTGEMARLGVIAVAGENCYFNGASTGTVSDSWSGTASTTVLIGARRREDTTSIDIYASLYLQALAVYDIVLSSTTILALSNRMNGITVCL